ncbi:hypothetical protein EDF31_11258 [Curtobacterium sp. PhB142]|nr:hypothetical protein EDF31_11258 [Curtobacterium sp. PhB142]TCL99780.1 hypothetical protein EDF26_11358 [Curtobacterium sp. PhB134]TCU43944.1 hypothetical protein EDF33_10757 [Curtobacterium sp. PhB146]TDW43073.1 hypothetical protein EDF52_11327 [Curtobacterium sp. PhB42]TDW53629.1 hypothetical protein EDF47_109141 [Curtobacterium sp. PhB190]
MRVAASGPHAHAAPVRVPSDTENVPRTLPTSVGCASASPPHEGRAPHRSPALLDGPRTVTTPQSGAASIPLRRPQDPPPATLTSDPGWPMRSGGRRRTVPAVPRPCRGPVAPTLPDRPERCSRRRRTARVQRTAPRTRSTRQSRSARSSLPHMGLRPRTAGAWVPARAARLLAESGFGSVSYGRRDEIPYRRCCQRHHRRCCTTCRRWEVKPGREYARSLRKSSRPGAGPRGGKPAPATMPDRLASRPLLLAKLPPPPAWTVR